MCNICTSNVNSCAWNTCGYTQNRCGYTQNRCGYTQNRCGWNTCQGCGLFSTLFSNACGCNLPQTRRCCNCVTICGNLAGVLGTNVANGTSTTNGEAYYARQYGLTGSGCNSCCNAYNTVYGND